MSADLFRAELGAEGLDDSGDLQVAKELLGYAGERFSQVHRVQPFGFTGVPPAGAHGIGLALRQMRDLAVVLGVEHPQYRPKNRAVGTTAIYDQWGNIVSLVQSELRIVHSGQVTIVAPTVLIQGDLHVSGAVIAGYGGGDQVGLQTHTHAGVQSGPAHTQQPDPGT